MEFKYHDTMVSRGVLFYIADNGNRIYFTHGGCLISVQRPQSKNRPEIAKFGLTVRGVGEGDRLVANYVRSELNNTGRGWAVPQTDEDVFLDKVDLLSHGPDVSDRDLCGGFELEIYDQYLTECMVSLKVSSGIVLTTGRDLPQDGTLRLFEVPTITNASSGFVYTPNRSCFRLIQAYLSELPKALEELIDGLFDGIPCPRLPINGDEPPITTDVIVTSKRAVPAMAVRPTPYATRALRRDMIISNFVQVRYIPKPSNIWDPRDRASGVNSIQVLCALIQRVDEILSIDDCWDGLDDELNESRSTINTAISALFGETGEKPFLGARSSAGNKITPAQRFVLCQFIFMRWNLFNCYATLERLSDSYSRAFSTPEPKPGDVHTTLDAVNDLLGEGAILGKLSVLIFYMQLHPMIGYKQFSPTVEKEAEMLTLFTAEHEKKNTQFLMVDELRRVDFEIAKLLDALFSGGGIDGCALAACRSIRNAVPVYLAMAMKSITAFDIHEDAARGAQFIYKLVTRRLRLGGCSGFDK